MIMSNQKHIYIYKTNICEENQVEALKELYRQYNQIKRLSVDREDIDKVLRIESNAMLSEKELIQTASQIGISCELLPD